jgi:hypothetical protein
MPIRYLLQRVCQRLLENFGAEVRELLNKLVHLNLLFGSK